MGRPRGSFLVWFLVVLQVNLSQPFMAGRRISPFGSNCTLRQSCNLSPDVTSNSMNCACVNTCAVYNDCCPDFEPEVELQALEESAFEMMNCEYMPMISHLPIYVTARCPADYDDDFTRHRCEALMQRLPLTLEKLREDALLFTPVSSLATTQLFTNAYCAICNGHREFTFWEVEFLYTQPLDLTQLTNNTLDLDTVFEVFPQFHMRISHPNETAHTCKTRVVRECDENWPVDETRAKCEQGDTLYVYRGDPYKNRACALCNHIEEEKISCRDPMEDFATVNPVIPSFSILFDFNSGFSGLKSYTDDTMIGDQGQECKRGSVWDPFQKQCIVLLCNDGTEFVNGRMDLPCVRLHEEGV